MPDKFILHSNYKPTGDQPEAIEKLSEGVKAGYKEQVLLCVTGSGKTFTMANIIANVNKLSLVLAHKKHLPRNFVVSFANFPLKKRGNILFSNTRFALKTVIKSCF